MPATHELAERAQAEIQRAFATINSISPGPEGADGVICAEAQVHLAAAHRELAKLVPSLP
jgi:hypothetical protein